MPIKIPDSLPATGILEGENIFVMTERRAISQDIRPLRILLLNLMPTKIETETQILRKLSNTPLQIEVQLLHTISHEATHTPSQHLESFYTSFNEIKSQRFDGLIITGAPIENMEFEEVDYWEELKEIMEWSKTNVTSTFHICWGAQAGIYYHYDIPKYPLPKKMSGIFRHHLVKSTSPLVRGLDDVFNAPHSRNTEVRLEDLERNPLLEVIAISDIAGVYIVKSVDSKNFFVFGHPEYDADTISKEYFRDLDKGINPEIPYNYFPDDDPQKAPLCTWRSQAQLIYSNWLNYYVYQSTPYDLN